MLGRETPARFFLASKNFVHLCMNPYGIAANHSDFCCLCTLFQQHFSVKFFQECFFLVRLLYDKNRNGSGWLAAMGFVLVLDHLDWPCAVNGYNFFLVN